ncbi:MAG TPA: phosphoribosylanthranilate isomerase [Bryobacteraceae bacterium]|jgi:phosphoribosylanthranilate isomerase|nr:phosphoribosylanthranilate isomerase [Bryobacteraceae bacterium]
MMVKICGITRRQDAVAAAEAGASALGFIFYSKSPRYVTPEKAREIGQGLKPWKVGVFVDEPAESLARIMAEAELDVAQIYGAISITGPMRFWQALRIPAASGGFAFSSGGGEAIFLDSAGNGVSFDWNTARSIAQQQKVIVAGGLNPENVADAIRIAKPWGVDASSGLEISPGIKDHEKVRRFIKAAREAWL